MTAVVIVSLLFGQDAARSAGLDFSVVVTVRCHRVFTPTQYRTYRHTPLSGSQVVGSWSPLDSMSWVSVLLRLALFRFNVPSG